MVRGGGGRGKRSLKTSCQCLLGFHQRRQTRDGAELRALQSVVPSVLMASLAGLEDVGGWGCPSPFFLAFFFLFFRGAVELFSALLGLGWA